MTQVQFIRDNWDAIKLMTQYEGGLKIKAMYLEATGKIMKDPQRQIRKVVEEREKYLRLKVNGETIQA